MKIVKKVSDNLYSKSTIVAFLLIFIVASIVFANNNFLSLPSVANMFLKAAKNGGFLALGMTFVILVGEIDLSVGAVLALSGVVMSMVGQYNPFLGIIAGLGVGILTGALTGFMVTKMNISSWIASIAMMFALRGLILLLSEKSIPLKGEILRFGSIKIAKGTLSTLSSGISILIPLFIIATLICMFVAKYTKFGLSLYAVGGNKEAAKMMGIDVNKTKMKAFICSGFLAALGGVLLASSSGSATLRAGDLYETYAIAMCALGGIKLTGGVGKFSGVFFGILIYFMINTIFTYLPSGISVYWQNIIMGILVLVSVAAQSDIFKNISFKKQVSQQ